MRELSFKDGRRTYRVVERSGTIEDIQMLSRTVVSGTFTSGGLYTPASGSTHAETIVTQRVFAREEDGGEWTFDCPSDVPLRPGTRVQTRYLGSEGKELQLARLTNLDTNHAWWWHDPVRRFLPRYVVPVILSIVVLGGLFAIAESSAKQRQAELRQWNAQEIAKGSRTRYGLARNGLYGMCYRTSPGCELAMSIMPIAAIGLAALFPVWFVRRRYMLQRLHKKVASAA